MDGNQPERPSSSGTPGSSPPRAASKSLPLEDCIRESLRKPDIKASVEHLEESERMKSDFLELFEALLVAVPRGLKTQVNLESMKYMLRTYQSNTGRSGRKMMERLPEFATWAVRTFYSMGQANWNKVRGEGMLFACHS